MAREKLGARKGAAVNPDMDGRLNSGDEHALAHSFANVSTPVSTEDPPESAGDLAIDDFADLEGNGDTTSFFFTVHRTGGSAGAVSVNWAVAFAGGAGSASGSDFDSPTNGTIGFGDGETIKVIEVLVSGDLDFEPDEAFTVSLSGATGGATIADGLGAGTIQNDDLPPNQHPVVAGGIGGAHNAEDAPITYTFDSNAFSDPDGDTLTYTAFLADGLDSPLPDWLSFDADSRTFSGTPPQDFNGTLSLRVYASDGKDSASTDFDLVVDPVNDAPVNTVPAGPIAVTEDHAQAITGLAVVDVDLGFDEITVTLSVLHGTLTVRDDVMGGIGAGDISGNSSATVVLHCHPDDINATLAALDGLVYTPDADYIGGDTLTMTSNDGGASGADPGVGDPGSEQDVDTVAINVTPPRRSPSTSTMSRPAMIMPAPISRTSRPRRSAAASISWRRARPSPARWWRSPTASSAIC
jgi:hypothetical protein